MLAPQHLLSINDLTAAQVMQLVHQAQHFKRQPPAPLSPPVFAATLFYENSTRTFMSFQLAAQRLGIFMTPLPVQQASIQKNESFLDTLLTLHAMGIQQLIIRHDASDPYRAVLPHLPASLHLINAGDGQHEHPSQALLDFMTILEHYPEPRALRIAIVGDIRHSRVATSFCKLCRLMGLPPVTLISPPLWAPQDPTLGTITDNLQEGLADAAVVIVLRVQRERLEVDAHLDLNAYHAHYALTLQTLAYAKPGALILHPGPMNRGIEISHDVAESPQSALLKQVQNGVWMRMAIMSFFA